MYLTSSIALHHAGNPAMRYHHSFKCPMRTENMYEEKHKHLKELEKVLVTRVENVSHELNYEHSTDYAEQITERENKDMLLNLKEETQLELKQVRSAIKRLDSGEYGICVQCGEAISPARLNALPYATRCIRCAN
jgi:RNA polymerase-binding protein DksA